MALKKPTKKLKKAKKLQATKPLSRVGGRILMDGSGGGNTT